VLVAGVSVPRNNELRVYALNTFVVFNAVEYMLTVLLLFIFYWIVSCVHTSVLLYIIGSVLCNGFGPMFSYLVFHSRNVTSFTWKTHVFIYIYNPIL
jgi:hypothetical protein